MNTAEICIKLQVKGKLRKYKFYNFTHFIPLVSWCLQEVKKETSGMIWINNDFNIYIMFMDGCIVVWLYGFLRYFVYLFTNSSHTSPNLQLKTVFSLFFYVFSNDFKTPLLFLLRCHRALKKTLDLKAYNKILIVSENVDCIGYHRGQGIQE